MKYLVSLGSCGCGGLFISRSWLWLSYSIQRLYLEHLQHCLGVTLTRLLRIYLSMFSSFRENLLLSLTCIQYSKCTAKCKHNIWLCHCITICQVFCSDWVYSIYAIQLHGMPRLPVTALLCKVVLCY